MALEKLAQDTRTCGNIGKNGNSERKAGLVNDGYTHDEVEKTGQG